MHRPSFYTHNFCHFELLRTQNIRCLMQNVAFWDPPITSNLYTTQEMCPTMKPTWNWRFLYYFMGGNILLLKHKAIFLKNVQFGQFNALYSCPFFIYGNKKKKYVRKYKLLSPSPTSLFCSSNFCPGCSRRGRGLFCLSLPRAKHNNFKQ